MRGSRPGERRGGRQNGTPNKKTAYVRAVMAAHAAQENVSPLDLILAVMREPHVALGQRVKMALKALPHMHVKAKAGQPDGTEPYDGSVGWEVDRSSMGKAVAAAITGRASDRLFEQFGKIRSRLRAGNNVIPLRGQRGGLPVVEAGIVQGGCGVSGAPTAEQDEECARAGIAALNIPATEPALVTYSARRSPSLSMASPV